MICDDVRRHLLDLSRGALPAELERQVSAHLETCPACARALAEEDVLTVLLARRPVYPASDALKRRLALFASAIPQPRAGAPDRWHRASSRIRAPAFAAAAALAIAAAAVLVDRSFLREGDTLAMIAGEAVSDHLRVLQRDRPVDLESSANHQVKPWFEGKLDFAPSVPAPVAADMRLEGGSVGVFLDRKAAVIVYGLRRHVLTLLVFRADGIRWPSALSPGERSPSLASLRGFHVFLWRSGGLAYALVGDVDPAELAPIAAQLAAST
jgi:anti-sigma factor RsiW